MTIRDLVDWIKHNVPDQDCDVFLKPEFSLPGLDDLVPEMLAIDADGDLIIEVDR